MSRRDDEAFRVRLRQLLERTGLSMRGLSAAFGRDPGYVAALLDPSRPSRAWPTPADLLRASDATGIALVELLELLWGVPPIRLAEELTRLGVGPAADPRLAGLDEASRQEVADFVSFLTTRRARGPRRGPAGPVIHA